MWFKNIKKPWLVLAPMADYTDSPFVQICRQVSGQDFVVFKEMVSSEALVRNNLKTLKMCEFKSIERPVVIQIFGSDPTVMLKAVNIIQQKYKPEGIDINMGCPVPKITGKVESGATLMKNQTRAVEIVSKIKKNFPDLALSIKTRLGLAKQEEILDFAPKLEAAGVNLLTIHGRTKIQGYSGKADWQMIGQVKNKLNIPVIANGDINSQPDITNCLAITKADGVMIGRAALGNPWIFRTTTDKSVINREERIKIILQHAQLHLQHYGDDSLVTFRKHLAWYFKSNRFEQKIKGIKKIRAKLVKVSSLVDLESILSR